MSFLFSKKGTQSHHDELYKNRGIIVTGSPVYNINGWYKKTSDSPITYTHETHKYIKIVKVADIPIQGIQHYDIRYGNNLNGVILSTCKLPDCSNTSTSCNVYDFIVSDSVSGSDIYEDPQNHHKGFLKHNPEIKISATHVWAGGANKPMYHHRKSKYRLHVKKSRCSRSRSHKYKN